MNFDSYLSGLKLQWNSYGQLNNIRVKMTEDILLSLIHLKRRALRICYIYEKIISLRDDMKKKNNVINHYINLACTYYLINFPNFVDICALTVITCFNDILN